MEAGLVSFIVAVLVAPVVASVARRSGVVSGSAGVRWSYEPKPLLGGISIILGILISLLIMS